MVSFVSQPVNTNLIASYFSVSPVQNCEQDAGSIISHALKETIEDCTQPDTKARKKALYRHNNPFGNLFGLCFSQSRKDRLAYCVQFIELLCIVDDVMEDLPFDIATQEHEILCQALDPRFDADQNTGKAVGGMKQFLRNLRNKVLETGDADGQMLLSVLATSLRQRDSDASEFDSLERYIPYRIVNFDYGFVCQLIRWTMGISYTEVDNDLARNFEHSIGVIVGLTNDYFSWDMERQQKTDRIRNAVPILMKQYSLPEKQAKSMVKGVIIDYEEKQRKQSLMLEQSQAPEVTEGMKQYVHALGLFASGYSYWCATCPRYHKPQKEEEL